MKKRDQFFGGRPPTDPPLNAVGCCYGPVFTEQGSAALVQERGWEQGIQFSRNDVRSNKQSILVTCPPLAKRHLPGPLAVLGIFSVHNLATSRVRVPPKAVRLLGRPLPANHPSAPRCCLGGPPESLVQPRAVAANVPEGHRAQVWPTGWFRGCWRLRCCVVALTDRLRSC